MSNWSLTELLKNLHESVERDLYTARDTLAHASTKGEASEDIWIDVLNTYLPERYKSDKAFVVDSKGNVSEQIDIVIYDRQYTPFVFNFKNQIVVPAESVYGVFEVKQSINAKNLKYAQGKVKSVRKLYRTSLPIPHAGGIHRPKQNIPIIGGILTLDSDWNPALGEPLVDQLNVNDHDCRLNMGCIAKAGYFFYDNEGKNIEILENEHAATSFIFKLISVLQLSGTVPMIDILAYSQWLQEGKSIEN